MKLVTSHRGVLDCVSLVLPEVRHTPMIGDAAGPKCQKIQKRTLYEQKIGVVCSFAGK